MYKPQVVTGTLAGECFAAADLKLTGMRVAMLPAIRPANRCTYSPLPILAASSSSGKFRGMAEFNGAACFGDSVQPTLHRTAVTVRFESARCAHNGSK